MVAGYKMAQALQASTDTSYWGILDNAEKPTPGQNLLRTKAMELLHSDTLVTVFLWHTLLYIVDSNYNLVLLYSGILIAYLNLPLSSVYLSLPVEFSESQWEKSYCTFSVNEKCYYCWQNVKHVVKWWH